MKTLYKIFLKSWLLLIFIVATVITAFLPAPVIAADSPESGFQISQWTGGTWEELYQHQFQIQYNTEAFALDVVDGKIMLRLVQAGTPFADIDQVNLVANGELIIPEYARYTENGQSVLEDILELDHNVVLAHEQEIEVSWDLSGFSEAKVYLTANEYGHALPFHFPRTGYAYYEMGTNTGSINVDGFITETDGTVPLYSPFWRPTTGHLDGYAYVYACDDGQYVYFSLDVTGDNTNEFGEDWAEMRILQPDGSDRAFRIDDFNTTWGKAGFGLTGKVSYKHQTYEFAIPKSLIGRENIEFRLEYYGTYGEGITLVYNAGTGGTVNGEDFLYQIVTPGELGGSVTATPDIGNQFVNWSDGETNATRTDYAPLSGVSVFTANFAIDSTIEHILTVSVPETARSAGCSVDGINSSYYYDDYISIAPSPALGWHFVNWSDMTGYDLTGHETDDPLIFNMPANDVGITANFAVTTYNLTYSADTGGSLTGETSQTVNDGADGTAVTAVPDTGYYFEVWSDGSIDNPRTDTYVADDISVVANFSIYTFDLNYYAGDNGSLDGITGQTVDYGTDGSPVEAVPDTGYHFADWSDGSTANPRTDTKVMESIEVTANFAIDTFTLTYVAGSNGIISGTTPQTVDYGSDGTAVTAIPNGGYGFVGWSDGLTANPRTDTGVISNIEVTANFAWVWAVTFDSQEGNEVPVQYVPSGLKVTYPTVPTKSGLYFGGWYKEIGCINAWNFNVETVSADRTLYAKWNETAPKVAIYASDTHSTDVRDKLVSTGLFSQVDLNSYGGSSTAPTLGHLLQYNAVFVYSNSDLNSDLGDVLADYIDAGGGVVIATFAFSEPTGLGIPGRISTGGYLPFTQSVQTSGTQLTLLPVEASHPILSSGSSFDGGTSSFHNKINLVSGATLVAKWSMDGEGNEYPLIATFESFEGRIVGLNFFPASSDAQSDCWDSSSQGALLMANSLVWASSSSIIYSPAITSNGGGDTASITAAENQTAVTTVTATNPNGATITFCIGAGGSDGAKFAIESTSGVLTFVNSLDYENPTDSDGDGIYVVTVQVSDGLLTDSQDINVTVTDVWEPVTPTITSLNNTTFTVGTLGSFIVTATGVPTPELSQSGAPDWVTFIDNCDGTATLSGTPPVGSGGCHPATFTVTNGYSPDANQTFTLHVNEAVAITTQPESWAATAGASTSISVEWNPTAYPVPTFQWQVNTGRRWTDIPGATSASYTFTPAAQMSGNQYRVVITGSNSVTSSTATLTVFKEPFTEADLSIEKTGQLTGSFIAWTITVTNNGPEPAKGVVVKDILARGTKFSSFDAQGSSATAKIGGSTVTVTIGTLNSQATVTFKINVLVGSRTTWPVDNTATVTTTDYDPDLTNNTVNPIVPLPPP